MKKLSLIFGIGAIMMASCSSDDVVNPYNKDVNKSENSLIGFNIRVGNQGRADMKSVSYDFGVYAYKANAETGGTKNVTNAAADGRVVMADYLVGFYDGTNGYVRATGVADSGTDWYYEGLGHDQFDATTFDAGETSFTAKASSVQYQDLKYWDKDYAKTYFYAYAPYIDKDKTGRVSFDPSTLKMTFPTITPATAKNYMYAFAEGDNEDEGTDGTANVDLKFTRLGSDIRVAFYGEIPGYTIEVENLGATNEGVYLVPAVPGEDDDDDYTIGKYVGEATPVVTFAGGAASVSYGSAPDADDKFCFAKTGFTKGGTSSVELSPVKTDGSNDMLCYSDTKAVVPGTGNCGFTLNVSFKLTARITNEVTYIRGAKVFIPANYCQWEPNTLYTYIFHVTKTVPGETGTDPVPDPTPDPNPALHPIIFENVTVEEIQNVNYDHWDLDGSYNPTTTPEH